MKNFDLIICRSPAESGTDPADPGIHRRKAELPRLSAADLNAVLQNASSPFLAVTEEQQSILPEELQQMVQRLESAPQAHLVLFFSAAHEDSYSAWQTLPHPLAALRENPAERIGTILGRVSTLQEWGFEDVTDPIWDLLIRASRTPKGIQVQLLRDEEGGTSATLTPPSLPALTPPPPGRSRSWLLSHLDSFAGADLGAPITSPPDAIALKAGLLQIHDYLEPSHEQSQSVQGRGRHSAGDYWHAIMHRREPDYSNAKYWFRNVGTHPIFEPLGSAVENLLSQTDTAAAQAARQKLSLGSRWDPFAFVDFCQECERGGDSDLTRIAQEIQWQEMQLLLEQTYHDATT